MTRTIMVAPPCCPFELSPLNELNRGKLVSSMIVIIPYLLAVALSFISLNIYTRLAVCNCLSFTFRSGGGGGGGGGGLSSLLMAIFMPLKELWEAYRNCTVRPSRFVSGAYLLDSLR